MSSISPQSTTPRLHLAIIPDGNRRWAKEQGLKNVWKGHEKAVENFRTLTDWCRKSGAISVLTVWCFSTENWKRDPKEIAALMEMLEEYLRKEKEKLLKEHTRFVHSGRRDRIPVSLREIIEELEEASKHKTDFTVHLAVDYGGKDETVRAVNRYVSQLPIATSHKPTDSPLSEETFRQFLDHPELPDIDIVLRSSGEQRTSNFFLWQTTYSEWIFSPKYFPEITTSDLEEAVNEYYKRKRRFGS